MDNRDDARWFAGQMVMDAAGAQLLFRVVPAACERRALGIASHWPFSGRFLPEHSTAVGLLGRLLHHASVACDRAAGSTCGSRRTSAGPAMTRTLPNYGQVRETAPILPRATGTGAAVAWPQSGNPSAS